MTSYQYFQTTVCNKSLTDVTEEYRYNTSILCFVYMYDDFVIQGDLLRTYHSKYNQKIFSTGFVFTIEIIYTRCVHEEHEYCTLPYQSYVSSRLR